MAALEMVQDKNGLIWLKDYDAIGTYNGNKFINLSTSLLNYAETYKTIYDLHADKQKNIWVCGTNTVLEYDDAKGFILHNILPKTKSLELTTITDDENANLILGSRKGQLILYNPQKKLAEIKFENASIGMIRFIYVKDAQTLWLTTVNGIYLLKNFHQLNKIYSFENVKFTDNFADLLFYKIKKGPNGNIFANDIRNHLLEFDENGKLLNKTFFDIKPPNDHVSDFIAINQNTLLVSTTEGVFYYYIDQKRVSKKGNNYTVKNQLYGDYCTSLLQTGNNVVWIGSGSSLSRINYNNEFFTNYSQGLPSLTMLVKEIKEWGGKWLIVSQKSGLVVYDPMMQKQTRLNTYKDKFIDLTYYDEINNLLWILSESTLNCYKFDKEKSNLIKKSNGIKLDEQVKDLESITSNSLYIVLNDKLYSIDINSEKLSLISSNYIKAITKSENNELYAGGDHFYRLSKIGKLDTLKNIAKVAFSDLAYANGKLWFSAGKNLMGYNLKDGVVKMYNEKNGIPVATFDKLLYDKNDNIWFGTQSGLCKFNITKEQCRTFTDHDGLVDNIYLAGLSCIKPGMIAGHKWEFFSYYTPKNLNEMFKDVHLKFTKILINNKDATTQISTNNFVIVNSLNSAMEFNFDFPCFLNTNSYTLQYRLKTTNDTIWHKVSTDNQIFLPKVLPGSYDFEIAARNNYTSALKKLSLIRIESLGPIYTRWWFLLLSMLIITLIIWSIFKFRENEMKKLINLRTSISRDLHDEMGSNLSNIKLIGELTLKQQENKNENIRLIVDKTIEVMHSMSDIVWSINPGNDEFESVILKIQKNAIEVLEPLDINLIFDIQKNISDIKLEITKRQTYYMICKEAINNIAKYAQAKNVSLYVNLSNKILTTKITDDGIGFDSLNVKRGNGLNNFKERALAVGGKVDIQSSLNQGTTIIFSFPV
ncbi:MAG: hypothetical protein RLZZ546_182 [Bacteroidota bacterium]|jgi:signal transduction histidine kinase/ligand-binding sensor domain-containing protein